MITREQVWTALFALLRSTADYRVAARRLRFARDTATPALSLDEISEEYLQHGTGFPAVRSLKADVYVYATTDPAAPPGTILSDLIDNIERVFVPPTGLPQTLGGLVTHCWIGGDPRSRA